MFKHVLVTLNNTKIRKNFSHKNNTKKPSH